MAQKSYSIDFESASSDYSDWEFNNMLSQQSGTISAHGGSYYGTTGGKTTASIVTKYAIASPESITFYVSKQSDNTKASNWKIQVSSDSKTWTDVITQSATSMSKGVWVEVTQDLSSYSNVYVRIYYNGNNSTAVRCIDDITLSTGSPKKVSSIAITGAPTKTKYFVGESLDTKGLIVTATYEDKSSADVTSNAVFQCKPATFTSYGKVEVRVEATYKEVTSDAKNYPITVCLSKTIDLTKDETTQATTEEMTWANDVVTIKSIRTSSGTTAANNYYPGTSGKTYTSTRFYKDNTLSFTPMNGNTIDFVVYEATTVGYATAMANSTWTNATASVSGETVTITPKDGAEVFSATIGATTGGNSFKIVYTEPVTLPGKSGELYYGTYSNNNSNVKITVDSENIVEVSTVTVSGGQLSKRKREGGLVAQGEGVLICSTTPKVTVTNISTSVTKDADNNLVATPFAKTNGEVGYKYYRMTYNYIEEESGLGFYWGAADGIAFDVAAEGKAILKVSEGESSGAKGFSFIWDDTNAIRDIEVAPVDSNAIYNMQGQRVNASAKGLLIKNGKKYISK